jgi:hypothetical protein
MILTAGVLLCGYEQQIRKAKAYPITRLSFIGKAAKNSGTMLSP